jgi:hypothetical protein
VTVQILWCSVRLMLSESELEVLKETDLQFIFYGSSSSSSSPRHVCWRLRRKRWRGALFFWSFRFPLPLRHVYAKCIQEVVSALFKTVWASSIRGTSSVTSRPPTAPQRNHRFQATVVPAPARVAVIPRKARSHRAACLAQVLPAPVLYLLAGCA